MDFEFPQRPHTVGVIPKWYTQSDSLAKVLQQIHKEARGPVERPKPPQKNYLKENLKRLKEIQARAKDKLAQKQTLEPLRVLPKQTQSKILHEDPVLKENVSSKFNQNTVPPKTAGPYRSKPPSSPCPSTKSETTRNLQSSRSLPQLNKAGGEEILPFLSKETNYHHGSRKQINFTSSEKESEPKSKTRHQIGQVPHYLTKRKKEWEMERERQLKLMEEASVPAGYTLLPDEERVETLELLRKNQEELIRALATLPVRNDTMRIRNRKEELERQLAKVEEGIKIFSRPKVLIKNDS